MSILLGLSYIVLMFGILLFISKIIPVLIINKIFHLELKKSRIISYVLWLVFFPLSILFVKDYYADLKARKKIVGKKGFVGIMVVLVLISQLLSLFVNVGVIREYSFKLFQVNGQSMSPSFYHKQIVITEKISNIERGDVIIMTPKVVEHMKFQLGRVIGLPGDKIKISLGKVYIYDKSKNEYIELQEKYLIGDSIDSTYLSEEFKGEFIYEVPIESYFVLGDNRKKSMDSRSCFGDCDKREDSFYVVRKDIIGKIYMDLGYFNIANFSFIHPTLGFSTIPKFFQIK